MADKYVGSLLNRIVLPGDVIGSVADLEGSLEGKNKVKLGLGLREVNGAIVAYKAGVFRHRNPSIYLINCNQRRASICKVFLLTIPSFFFFLIVLHGTLVTKSFCDLSFRENYNTV